MRFSANLALLCLALLFEAVSPSANCAPVDFAQAQADAVWIVHADFDALRQSTVYRDLTAHDAARWKPLADKLSKINAQLGMDLAKDLHGMTVYGAKPSAAAAVLVMQGDWDPQTFRGKMALTADHSMSNSGRYEIHRFTRKDRGRLRAVAGACWQPGTFVFGETARDVQLGLDVLDGRRRRLADRGLPLSADVPAGTVFLARMIAAGDSLPVESPLLKQTEQIDLACGEKAGECFVRGRFLAKTAVGAEQAKQAIDGVLAMARLNAAGDAAAKKLLDRIEVRTEDHTVRLDFCAPAKDLTAVLERVLDKTLPAKRE
jgi:hypothetical protein